MNHITKVTLTVIAAAFVAAYATASPHDGHFPISIADAQQRTQDHFDKVDQDGNGMLSSDEFAAAYTANGNCVKSTVASNS